MSLDEIEFRKLDVKNFLPNPETLSIHSIKLVEKLNSMLLQDNSNQEEVFKKLSELEEMFQGQKILGNVQNVINGDRDMTNILSQLHSQDGICVEPLEKYSLNFDNADQNSILNDS